MGELSIVSIIMVRDGMTRDDAQELYDLTAREVQEAIDSGATLCDIEGIVADNLGLEPDYVDHFIF